MPSAYAPDPQAPRCIITEPGVGYRFVTSRASDGLTPLPAATSDGVCVRRHAHQCADGEPRRQSRGAPELTHETAMIAADVVTALGL